MVIAHPDYARYIHLAIRNPDPSRFIWWWRLTKPPSNETVCEVVERAGVERVIIAGYTINATIEGYRCLEELRHRHSTSTKSNSGDAEARLHTTSS